MTCPESGALNPAQRTADLQRLANEPLDLLIIGGGVTGVGCALDAVTRGLSVGLVEQRDLASGTSSRSSKLMHGGLRYLQERDFALVREALQERGLHAAKIAPHLVRPVSFLIPLTGRIWQRAYYGAGVLLYDLLALAKRNPFPRHRHLSRRKALQLAPGLKRSKLIGAIVYHDAQIDDARHTVAVARTAARHGAAIATSTQVRDLIIEDGVVVGAQVTDIESGDYIEIRAHKIINATGVWIDDIQDMAGPSAGLRVHASKGVHIVVPRSCIDSDSGLVLETTDSVLFIISWGEFWLLGTTDTTWELDRAHPAASSTDIDYLLDQANEALQRPLSRDDIVGVYAGLRPLIAGADEETARLSREHAVAQPVPGLISIAGGKYTTYRIMAADAVDMAVEGIDRPTGESVTDRIELIGAAAWEQWRHAAPRLAAQHNLPTEVTERLLWRHGSQVAAVLSLTTDDATLLAELPGGGYIAAEAVYAVTAEGALHLEDILARRMRISIETVDRGTEIAAAVAGLVAPYLGWSESDVANEVEAWHDRVDAELLANGSSDDQSAATARRRAVDGRGLIDA